MPNTYHIYVLRSSSTNKLYVGQTNNLELRVDTHNKGVSRYTNKRGPWKLIYSEEFASRSEALKREMFLKSGKGRELIKTIIKEKGI